VITYSGDTEWTESLLEAARGADLFICEAYVFEKKIKYHLDYAALRLQAGRIDCRRLILTHLGPDMLSRLDEVELEHAADGKRITV
jgi:ribonuclease BN (tRNA processing enzyme)